MAIKIIKTLPHLHNLFINQKANVAYSLNYSLEAFNYIEDLKFVDVNELKYSSFLKQISETGLNSNIDNDFRIGEPLTYTRVDNVEQKLQFSIKGDIVHIWILGYKNPLRIEFFGEDCEKITEVDSFTLKNINEHKRILFSNNLPSTSEIFDEIIFSLNSIKSDLSKIIFTPRKIDDLNKFHTNTESFNTDFVFPQLFFSNKTAFSNELNRLKNAGFKIYLTSLQAQKIANEVLNSKNNYLKMILEDLTRITGNKISQVDLKNLAAGLISEQAKIAIFTDREVFGTVTLNNRAESKYSESSLKRILRQFEGEINIGDYIVHEDYGIGIYSGLKQESAGGIENHYVLIKFAEDDELFVPIDQIKKITKYLGVEGAEPKLTRLGKGGWQVVKSKAKKTAYLTAKQLIEHFAKKELSNAEQANNNDTNEYKEFVEQFEYIETNDQITAISEILQDLTSKKPMNRLLVGDVGFGKTEVIMRAAFKMVEAKTQVVVLAPTTVLVAQHYEVFKKRFKDFNFRIESVSRFKTVQQNKKIIDDANSGKVDILIGTHRLLSSDVKLKNLGLVVVDEEQKFGVKQKEKIKQLNYGAHVLSVSATPIPRSLSLALSSIQDISIITTPPEGRKAVQTEIIYENWEVAANKIQEEVSRGGQVYFVHNRVRTIKLIEAKLKEFIPNIRFGVAHGQMNADKLDKIMADFYLKKYDCLLCTSIIENGLDLPNVNTVIVHDAHTFGLSQLYQLRGRVGRGNKKAFCYLMCPRPNKAVKLENTNDYTLIEKNKIETKPFVDRLQTLVDNQDLGAGFKIASKDLEIRGAGSILGEKQSGHINVIGYALYIEMLAEEVEKLKNEKNLNE